MLLFQKSILAGLLALSLTVALQSQTLHWAGRFNNFASTHGILSDAQGDLISIGTFSSVVDIDPGPLVHNLFPTGSDDIYILKLNSDGNFLWVKQIGGPDFDAPLDLVQDRSGNLYITGVFIDSTDFDPGQGINRLKSNGGYDVFIEKLDSAGNFIWVRSFGRQTNENVRAIRVDASGNVYTVGSFFQQVDFDPGPDTFFLTAQGLKENIFIQKLDSDGNFKWAKQFGGGFTDYVTGLELDPSGNIWLCGNFVGPAILQDNSTIDTTLAGIGWYDIFLFQLDTDAKLLRAMQFGDAGYDRGGMIAIDSLGGILMSGSFGKTVDFDPGPDTFLLSTDKQFDGVLLRLEADGQFKWARQFGGGTFYSNGTPVYQDPSFQSMLFDKNGQIFISGTFQGNADFDPGPAEFPLHSINDSYDIYIQKLSPDGNMLWAKALGNTSLDGGCWIDADPQGNLYLSGNFTFNIDIDPGPGVTTLQGSSFIAKWQQGFDFYGKIFQDTNANLMFDPGEKLLRGVVLTVPGEGQYASTNSYGQYHIDADLYGDTIMPAQQHSYWTFTPSFQIADSNHVEMDFAVNIPPDVVDLGIDALEVNNFRRGINHFWINLTNYGVAPTDSSTVKLVLDDAFGNWLTIADVYPPPQEIVNDTIVWRVGPIKPDTVITIKIKFAVSPFIPNGASVNWIAFVSLPGDIDTLNNIFSGTSIVFGPHDPNDKRVDPDLASAASLNTTRLHYAIRFQNVGNAPAELVVIRDTLPTDLQIARLNVLSASHPFDWQLSEAGLLEFRFPDINLPDSTHNELESHGYVLFEILPGNHLAQGDSVLNRAGIYFDLNPPVLTPYAVFRVAADSDGDGYDSLQDCNDQDATIHPAAFDIPGNALDEDCDGQDAMASATHHPQIVSLQLRPNPAQGRVQVIFEQPESGVLEVHTVDGRRVLAQKIEQQPFIWLNMQDSPAGVYAVRLLKGDKCVALGQVVLR